MAPLQPLDFRGVNSLPSGGFEPPTDRREAERIEEEVAVEMVVWDPVMEVG
jgi:hypothetical protein